MIGPADVFSRSSEAGLFATLGGVFGLIACMLYMTAATVRPTTNRVLLGVATGLVGGWVIGRISGLAHGAVVGATAGLISVGTETLLRRVTD